MTDSASKIDVAYVAKLARLELAPEAMARLQKDMLSIVAYIDELSAVDVTGVEPTAHAAEMTNVWREDAVKPSFPSEAMLDNAPAVMNGELVRVPQVLPGEGIN